MESLADLVNKKKYQRIKDESEAELIERGYILTKVFGWITRSDVEWLNKKLERTNLNKTVEELEGIPGYEVEVSESKKRGGVMQEIKRKVTVVYPFVNEYFEMKKAQDSNMQEIIRQESLI